MRTCLSACLRACATGLLVAVGVFACGLAVCAPAHASGLLIPEQAAAQDHVQLDGVKVRAHIRGRAAEVTVVHVFRNRGEESLAADFVYPLPAGAVIEQPELHHGEDTLSGTVTRGKAARALWTTELKRLRDPLLVRHLGTDAFRAELPALAPGARMQLTFTFEQRLGSDAGVRSFLCGLGITPSFEIDINLETTAPLGPIYSPTHALSIERAGPQHARIRYAGAATLERPCLGLYWSTTRSRIGATLLTYWPQEAEEGYYIVLAAPTQQAESRRPRRAQSITFVVDISGSMMGSRMEGMRAALQGAIRGLEQHDHFNVIAYHSEVAPLWPEPRPATVSARAEALGFVDGLRARGHTNIEGALRRALMQPRPEGKPSVVLFLTDGRPTNGETDPNKILASIRRVNAAAQTRIYVLGVGVDTHTVMLDRLALENGGEPAFVPPRESVEKSLAALYTRIRHPVLTDVTFAAHGMKIRETIASKLPDLLYGGQLILAGRYKGGGPVEIVLSGRDGAFEREYHYARAAARRGDGLHSDFPARVWAMRRLAALIDAIRLRDSRTPELLLELVRLSTHFGVLTEYTSFIADESCSSCSDVEGANTQRTKKNIEALASQVVGAHGLAQAKGQAERRSASRIAHDGGTWVATSDGRDVRRVATPGVRMLGNRTFFFRGPAHGWVEATLGPTHAPDARIERWSPEFFALLGKTTPEENERLAQPGRLLLRVQGRILRIVDPA